MDPLFVTILVDGIEREVFQIKQTSDGGYSIFSNLPNYKGRWHSTYHPANLQINTPIYAYRDEDEKEKKQNGRYAHLECRRLYKDILVGSSSGITRGNVNKLKTFARIKVQDKILFHSDDGVSFSFQFLFGSKEDLDNVLSTLNGEQVHGIGSLQSKYDWEFNIFDVKDPSVGVIVFKGQRFYLFDPFQGDKNFRSFSSKQQLRISKNGSFEYKTLYRIPPQSAKT